MAADYLARLLERTLGRSPTAQPLIRPLFAPGPSLAADPGADTHDPAAADLNAEQPPDSFVASLTSPSPLQAAQQSHPSVREPRSTAAVERARAIESASAVEGRARRDATAQADRRQASRPNESASFVLRAEQPIASRVVETMADRPASQTAESSVHDDYRPLGMPAADRARLGAERSNEASRAVLSPNGEPLSIDDFSDRRADWRLPLSKNILPITPRSIEPESMRERESLRAHFGGESARQHDAPVIRVTIGRVEVRAVMAATERAARPAHSPKARALSLEDYLRQRNSGER